MEEETKSLEHWLSALTGTGSMAAIARKIGVPQRTFANHVSAGTLTFDELAKIGELVNLSTIDMLAMSGAISDNEVRKFVATYNSEIAPLRDLLEVLLDRLDLIAAMATRLRIDKQTGESEEKLNAKAHRIAEMFRVEYDPSGRAAKEMHAEDVSFKERYPNSALSVGHNPADFDLSPTGEQEVGTEILHNPEVRIIP
ncbi:MAG: hypothetical protein E6X52_01150 [Actinomyces sp.]|uniref:hypothetical protein n=1 Tax=uncultured Actinomyces sp. TaxID=249061 RepID=UPI002804264A|nr:hypothetical protein [uncultured Actinomyces sp.]MDU4831139.1 hypothetical protein [Actinomyces sp.]